MYLFLTMKALSFFQEINNFLFVINSYYLIAQFFESYLYVEYRMRMQ